MSTIRKTLKDKDGNYFCPAIPSRSIEGGDIKLGAVKAENIDFTTLLFGNYSLQEQDTGFTWVDGYKVYKKTIDFGALPANDVKNVAHNIDNLRWVIRYFATSMNSAGQFLTLPWSSRNYAADNIELQVDTANVKVSTSSSWPQDFATTYVTILYTKNQNS